MRSRAFQNAAACSSATLFLWWERRTEQTPAAGTQARWPRWKKKNPPGFEEKRLPCVIPLTENKTKVQGNYETPNRGDWRGSTEETFARCSLNLSFGVFPMLLTHQFANSVTMWLLTAVTLQTLCVLVLLYLAWCVMRNISRMSCLCDLSAAAAAVSRPDSIPARIKRCLGRNPTLLWSHKFISAGVVAAAPAPNVSRALIGLFKNNKKQLPK